MRKKWLVLPIISGFACGSVLAWADATLGSEESGIADKSITANDTNFALDQELLWLQSELTDTVEAYTDLATKTKLSADQVPGMVSVLRGKDLEARGVRTVVEALKLFPGMNSAFSNPTVRGIEGSSSGKIKILVNGLPFNSTITANPTPPFALPVEMIERIEMIRGPGSAVYGEFASVGVINIVTLKEGKRVYARHGSYDYYSGGGIYSYTNPEKELALSFNLSGFKKNGEEIHHEQDILHTNKFGQPGTSKAPGTEFNNEKQQSGVFTLNHKDFSLVGQYMQVKTGAGPGLAFALPPPDERLVWGETQWGLEAKQAWNPAPTIQANFKVGWTGYSMEMDKNTLFPPGVVTWAGLHPNGVVASTYIEERRLYGSVDATLKKWDRHDVMMGLEFASIEMVDVWTEANTESSSDMSADAWKRFDDANTYVKGGAKRQVTGVMLQDQIAITDQFDLTAGLRFDHYDDVGTALTPRIAAVYRVTDRHNLKAQYGSSFRPPTFFEMYINNYILVGNPEIEPETVDTYELGYIYRDPDMVARATLFYSDLKELIGTVPIGGVREQYVNSSGVVIKGVELELEKTLSTKLKIDGNLSFVDTEDEMTGADIGGSANWLGNVGVIYQPLPQYALSVHYRYVGTRNRLPDDPRPELGSTSTFDLTGSMFNLWQKGLTLRVGAINVFDADVIEPDLGASYPADFPRPGRHLWMKLAYDF